VSRSANPAPAKSNVDVVIAGGGQVGLALALALRRAAPTLAVAVIDATLASDAARSGRASTIAAGGRRLLTELGVWPTIEADAQPVTSMIVTDSRTNDVVRPVFLTFGSDDGVGGVAAHLVADGIVVAALRAAAVAAGVAVMAPDEVTDFAVAAGRVEVTTRSGATLRAALLVAADGARSALRALAGIDTVGWSYGQSGIVATVAHAKPHGGRAEEHFLPGGPFAILPLRSRNGENLSSLVWTEPTDVAEQLVALDPLSFGVELTRRFGHRLGEHRVVDAPRAFPLGLQIARTLVKERLALVGDAAHTIHPIAGQGLNLGYRDVAALAETIVEAHRLGLDVGARVNLERYEQWRHFDTIEMGLVTDGLNRLFSNDNAMLRAVRDVGLSLTERMPSLKRLFTAEAEGATAAAPRLLRGEAI
jgi:2-octaprenyl-6-methoxyphenol hydroxylase